MSEANKDTTAPEASDAQDLQHIIDLHEQAGLETIVLQGSDEDVVRQLRAILDAASSQMEAEDAPAPKPLNN